MINLKKLRRIMPRSIKLGHCVVSRTKTDKEGRYLLRIPIAGRYIITAYKDRGHQGKGISLEKGIEKYDNINIELKQQFKEVKMKRVVALIALVTAASLLWIGPAECG